MSSPTLFADNRLLPHIAQIHPGEFPSSHMHPAPLPVHALRVWIICGEMYMQLGKRDYRGWGKEDERRVANVYHDRSTSEWPLSWLRMQPLTLRISPKDPPKTALWLTNPSEHHDAGQTRYPVAVVRFPFEGLASRDR